MESKDNKIPSLNLNYGEINSNHKLKLLALQGLKNYWIVNMAFARKDSSIYLSPQINRVFTVTGLDNNNVPFLFESSPETSLHFSLHASGVVNISSNQYRYRLKNPTDRPNHEVVTLTIKNPTLLKIASLDSINMLPDRYKTVPIPGFIMVSPILVTVFRPPKEWEFPLLSRIFQLNLSFRIKDTNTRYTIVVWQNPDIASNFSGDIALSFG